MRTSIFRRRIAHNNHLFTAQYIDPRALFAFCFGMLPNVSYINDVEVNAAYAFIRSSVEGQVQDTLQHACYNYDTGNTEFNVTFIVLFGDRLIEIGGNYVTLFHSRDKTARAVSILQDIAQFRIQDSARAPIGFATRQVVNN
jgi:hypothetical protein